MRFLRTKEEGLEEVVRHAVAALKVGGIVLYPTDTLYGLAVDASNKEALERLRELKGRERRKPISLVVHDLETLETYAELSEEARVFAQKHFPGALTLVVPARPHIPEELLHYGAVGLRIPNDPFALMLSKELGAPFTATSANRSGHPTHETPMDIVASMGPNAHLIDLVIDDGPRRGGIGSTVVLYTGEKPLILRGGPLSRETLGIA